jgi:hypothetical protein
VRQVKFCAGRAFYLCTLLQFIRQSGLSQNHRPQRDRQLWAVLSNRLPIGFAAIKSHGMERDLWRTV